MKITTYLTDESLENPVVNIDLEFYQKNTSVLNVIVRNEELQVVDVTGATAFFTIKDKTSDSDDDAKLKKTIASTSLEYPTSGEFNVTLSKTDTASLLGNYLWDLKLKQSDGTIYSLAEGTICFKKIISIRET